MQSYKMGYYDNCTAAAALALSPGALKGRSSKRFY